MSDGFRNVLPCLYVLPEGDDPMPELVLRTLAGNIATSYTVEHGDNVRTLTTAELIASGATAEALHERALVNLARHVAATGIRLNAYGSVMAVLFDGDMEATLMLYEPLWTRLHDEMGDRLVAVAPARDVLAVAPADSAGAVVDLCAIVERVWPRDDHPLSSELFAHDEGGWTVLARPTGSR